MEIYSQNNQSRKIVFDTKMYWRISSFLHLLQNDIEKVKEGQVSFIGLIPDENKMLTASER